MRGGATERLSFHACVEARDTKSATGLAVLKPDGFNTERRSDGETELSRLRGSEGYEVRDDDRVGHSALSAVGWEVAHGRRGETFAVLCPRPLPPKAQICSFKWQLSRKELYN